MKALAMKLAVGLLAVAVQLVAQPVASQPGTSQIGNTEGAVDVARPTVDVEEPSMERVAAHMVAAADELTAARTGEKVQREQRTAIDLLERLIEQAEQQENQCSKCKGKGCKQCNMTGKKSRRMVAAAGPPNSPAEQSTLPQGSGGPGEQKNPPPVRPGEQWGQMRPEERERILQSVGEHLPSQYRPLIEQYYKQLGKEQ